MMFGESNDLKKVKAWRRNNAKPLIETHNLEMLVKLQFEETATTTNDFNLTTPTRLLVSVRTALVLTALHSSTSG
jgi:hypothetical protein